MANISLKNNRTRLIFFMLPYVIPVILLWVKIIPYEHRYFVLVAIMLFMSCYAYLNKYTWLELGFRTDTLKQSFFWNAGFSVVMILVLLLSFKAGWIRKPTIPDWNLFFVNYILISGPFQEFLYRSIFFAELNRNFNFPRLQTILLVTINYTFLHAFYNDWITLVATFLIGLFWTLVYERYPNFWGVAFSHSVLGAVSIFVGLI